MTQGKRAGAARRAKAVYLPEDIIRHIQKLRLGQAWFYYGDWARPLRAPARRRGKRNGKA